MMKNNGVLDLVLGVTKGYSHKYWLHVQSSEEGSQSLCTEKKKNISDRASRRSTAVVSLQGQCRCSNQFRPRLFSIALFKTRSDSEFKTTNNELTSFLAGSKVVPYSCQD
ncbi:hypothetical protein Tco_0488652 [Tanacetum coccineum]